MGRLPYVRSAPIATELRTSLEVRFVPKAAKARLVSFLRCLDDGMFRPKVSEIWLHRLASGYWIMNSQNPVIDLMRLIGGFQVSQAISVIAELGIADVLKNDALHIDAIAQATECHPRSLYRLLHMLASSGVLEELTGQHFKLTPLGECLSADSDEVARAYRDDAAHGFRHDVAHGVCLAGC
jgi:hypothetical protein